MAAASATIHTTSIGPVDALIDVARGPCVDTVALRGEVAEALLGLASAVGKATPEAGQWLGVEGQLEILRHIEAGLVQMLGDLGSNLHARTERGLKRLCWCVQVAQDALQDMVRGTLVRDEWVDGVRLDRVYGSLVSAWAGVSAAASECIGKECLLAAAAEWAAERTQSLRDHPLPAGGGQGSFAAQVTLVTVAASLRASGDALHSAPAADLEAAASTLSDLRKLDMPVLAVVEGDELGGLMTVGLSHGGRAFMCAQGGGMILEWRSDFKPGASAASASEDAQVWAEDCRTMVHAVVSDMVLGQRLNAWAESEGCAPPVQALRGFAARVEQRHTSSVNPLGARTSLVLQLTVDVGVPVAGVVGDEAWEDVGGDVKAGVARKCLSVLSACEESGAGYAGGDVLGALVVEGGTGIGGGIGEVASDVVRGVASVQLCAGSVGQVVREIGCREWSEALRGMMSLGHGGGGGGAGGGVLASFDDGSVWGSFVDVSGGGDVLVCAAQQIWSECDDIGGLTRVEVGDGEIGRVWDVVAANEGKALGLWRGMRQWRVEVMVSGNIEKAGRCSGLVDLMGKVRRVVEQGCDERGCMGMWECLMSGDDLVRKAVGHMKAVAGVDGGAWSGKDAVDVDSMRHAGRAGDAVDCWALGVMYAEGRGVEKDEAEAVKWLSCAAQEGHVDGQVRLGLMYFNGSGVDKNDTEAVRWYRAAAQQGDPGGQTNLGFMYEHGKGVDEDEAEAVKWYTLAAKQGHPEAQVNLGIMYEHGTGVGEDEAEAARWYRAAAEQGDPDGQNNLGDMYEHGKGVEEDEAEAVKWYRAAAQQGLAQGQVNLGDMYDQGKGVDEDAAKAARWYRAAAQQGDPGGQTNLGFMYEHGKGVDEDEAEAVKWYTLAAKQGHPEAQVNLGTMYEHGTGVGEDEAEAARWYRAAAEQGDPDGQNNLGDMYEHGKGVEEDEAEAVKWYRAAAQQGLAQGQVNLGDMYDQGKGVDEDAAKAARWYRAAAQQGDPGGQTNLGFMYEHGKGVDEDEAEAVKWYTLAAKQGHPEAQVNLGTMYEHGTGVGEDEAEAARWYRAAAEQGDPDGQNNLGDMYEHGKGVEEDEAEAVKWYRAAAQQGLAEGQFNLGDMYEHGKGVVRDEAEAVRWYRAAAQQGNVDGQVTLGDMYEHGKGVAKDEAEAVRWLRAAAEQEHEEAQFKLGSMFEDGIGVAQDEAEAMRWFKAAAEQGQTDALEKVFGEQAAEKFGVE